MLDAMGLPGGGVIKIGDTHVRVMVGHIRPVNGPAPLVILGMTRHRADRVLALVDHAAHQYRYRYTTDEPPDPLGKGGSLIE